MAKRKSPKRPNGAPETPDRRIEYVPLPAILEAKRNPKAHADAAIKESIGRFGYVEPMVMDERTGHLVAGHGRLTALRVAKQAGQDAPQGIRTEGGEWLAPVLRGWASRSDTEAEAYLLASNQLTLAGGWDEAQLAEVVKELESLGAMEGLGFDEEEIARLIAQAEGGGATDGLTDPDAVPEPSAESWVRPGDLFALGAHRILCGDSTMVEDVRRVMGADAATCVLTDPPYGQDQPGVPGDEPANHPGLMKAAVALLPLASDATCVAFQSPRTFPVWLDATRNAGLKHERMLWLVKKAQMAYPWRGWILISESILVSSVGKAEWNDVHPYTADCYELASVQGELPDGIGWHGSVKPMSVVSDILGRISVPDALVYEPFSGSGTTLIACEKLGRRCRAIEIEPRYVQVAIERWEAFTGKKAEKLS